MKKTLTILFVLFALSLSATTYYVAPSGGSDGNAGTIGSPWATWQKAFATANAGDTVYFRGGVYYSTNTNTIDPEQQGYLGGPVGHSGTAENPIVYMSYPNEWAILDCSQHCETIPLGEYYNPLNDIYNTAIYVAHVRNITFKDFEVRNVFQCDSVLTGAITSLFSCYMTFDHIVLHNVSERGFQVESGAYKTWYADGWTPGIAAPYWDFDIDTIRFINCDVYDLCDSLSETMGNGADAFHTSMSPENVYIWEGCRIWNYSDDGLNIDGGGGGLRKVNNCWLMPSNKYYYHGGGWTTERNGFKTGWNASNDGWQTLLWPKPTEHNTLEVSNSLVLFAEHGFREGPNNIGYWHNNTSYKCAVGMYSSQDCSVNYPRPSYKNNLVYKTTMNWGGIPGWPYMTLLIGDPYDESHNTWDYADNSAQFVVTDSVTVTDIDFIGLEGNDTADSLYLVSLFTAPRQAGGSLPTIKPLTLASTSDLIDAGTKFISSGTQNVDLTLTLANYNGVAPDIGYAEYGETSTRPMVIFITSIYPTISSASIRCNVYDDGGNAVIRRGVCWGTSANPTITNDTTINGISTGEYIATIYPLLTNTTYHARAYAVNSEGIGYSDDVAFTTLSITDRLRVSKGGVSLYDKTTGKQIFINAGASPQTVLVTGITVSGAGGATTITADGGTLQMLASVLPANATDKTITWSVINNTGSALISASGLLTAITDGNITVRATANDDSEVYDDQTITISNQDIVTSISVFGTGGATTISTNGGTLQMLKKTLPVTASDTTVTWSVTSGTGSAFIGIAGLLTALTNGTVTVRATANDGSAVYGTKVITLSNQTESTQIIADHTVVDRYDDIPQEYINEVKKMWVTIPGQSHAEAYFTGALLLEQDYPAYAVSVVWSGTPEAYTTSNLRLSGATWGNRDNATGWQYQIYPWDLAGGEPYAWTYDPTQAARVETGISYAHANNLTIAAMAYGYCYNDGYYLSYVTAFQRFMDYCIANSLPTKIFFTTGPVDGFESEATELAYESSQRWVYIRNHVAADETRILFDYADILCHNDAGVLQTQTWNGHTFPVIHPDNTVGGSGIWATGHIGGDGDLRIGKALWWMLARIAGWDGN